MTYRTQATVPPEPRHRGPRAKCPACGECARTTWSGDVAVTVTPPRACWFARRIGFLWLRRCPEPGVHLHQSCKVCGHAWACDPLETP